MIELFMCYNLIKSRSIFFDRLLLSNLHIELKLVDLIYDMYTHAADKWRKYCQYGVKRKSSICDESKAWINIGKIVQIDGWIKCHLFCRYSVNLVHFYIDA